MTINLAKLANSLGSKRSTIQKTHSISFGLMLFKLEITVWFYFKASFCSASIFNLYSMKIKEQTRKRAAGCT